MTFDARSVARDAEARPEITSNSTRLLLLLSVVMVMMATPGDIGSETPRLAALLVAVVAAGFALLRPELALGLDSRLLEKALVGTLLLAGLFLTGVGLVPAFTNRVSPLSLAMLLLYILLGLAAGLPLVRGLPQARWAFPLFLVAHTAMTVALLRATPISIDVQVYLHDGVMGLIHGHNPYSMTIPNIYAPQFTEMLYGHDDILVGGRVNYGFPYLPVSLLVAFPGYLLGDVRYSQLIAMLVTVLVLRRLASDRIGRAVSILALVAPGAITILTKAWVEPTLVALLACLVLALERQRHSLVAVFLGLFLASKQHIVVAIPTVWLICQSMSRRVIVIGFSVAAALILPFVLVDPEAFWRSAVELQLKGPLRPDSLSLLVSSVQAFGWPPPWTYGVLPLLGGGLTAIVMALRAPRTPAAFAAAVGLTMLVTILLSKQAFMNYYFLVSGAFLIAAVAWPTKAAGDTEA